MLFNGVLLFYQTESNLQCLNIAIKDLKGITMYDSRFTSPMMMDKITPYSDSLVKSFFLNQPIKT